MPRPVGFTPEDEGAKKKWDAWKHEQGLSKTEAKRRYIAYLLETMRLYASGTPEARELLGELEDLWNQIKNIRYVDEELDHGGGGSGAGAGGGGDHTGINRHLLSPSQTTLFGHDRYSTKTPSILGRPPTEPYRNQLERIYSHSRRTAPFSVAGYSQYQGGIGGGGGVGEGGSVYSMPLIDRDTLRRSDAGVVDKTVLEDFKNWQGEVNMVINRLTREFIKTRSGDGEMDQSDEPQDHREYLKRRIVSILRIIGINVWHVVKNFSISVLSMMFIVWCIKRNVTVKRTLVTLTGANGKQKKELVINMVLNTRRDKWFIRLLNFINSFVGFV